MFISSQRLLIPDSFIIHKLEAFFLVYFAKNPLYIPTPVLSKILSPIYACVTKNHCCDKTQKTYFFFGILMDVESDYVMLLDVVALKMIVPLLLVKENTLV